MRLTVESVERHVPSTVRVQVLDALPDPQPPGTEAGTGARSRSVDERAEASR